VREMSLAGLRGVTLLLVAVAFAVATPFAVGAIRQGQKTVQPGNPVLGKVLFQEFCGKCHAFKAAGTKGTTGPNLDQDKINYAGIVTAVIAGVGGVQAEYKGQKMTFPQIYDVAKFVVTRRPRGHSSPSG
jgi:mono/diheme cytochrome c family protein